MTAPDPGLTDLIAAHLTELIADAPAPNHEEDNYDAGYVAALADLRDSAAFKLVVEHHTNGRIAELEAELEKYHAEERRQLEWDRFCAQQDVRCTECGLRYGERKDYTCPHIGEHKYDADELRAALEGEQQ